MTKKILMNNFFYINLFIIFLTSFFPQNINNYSIEKNLLNLYKTISEHNINYECFNYALHGYQYLKEKNLIKNHFIIIVDFTLPSFKDRLYLIDLNTGKLILKTKVAHGKNSGEIQPSQFSNKPNSNMSSLGFYITEEDYIGRHGYSLRLKGLEPEINDNAIKRGIVIHGAEYVSDEYIKKYGRIGRSNGCIAVPIEINEYLIKTIKEGSLVFVYFPDIEYFKKSKIFNN